MTTHALVVGGGIAGLSTARALTDAGLGVTVLERGDGAARTGAGLYLPANAVRALGRLGLGEALAHIAHPIDRQTVTDARGRPLVDVATELIWGELRPCRATRHADLHALLRMATRGLDVRLRTTVTAVRPDGRAELSDGSVVPFDLLVGADGVRSATRAGLGGAEPRFAGQWAWRSVVHGAAGLDERVWTARLARGRTVLTVPLGGGATYVYADVNVAAPAAPGGDWRTLFADLAGPVAGVLARATEVHSAPVLTHDPPHWGSGRMALVGDAAHALPPSMAQGVALAVEDALVLAESLRGQPVPDALSAYARRRAPRVAWVQAQTRRRESTRNLSPALRDPLLRLTGRRLLVSGHRPLRTPP